MDRKYAVPGLSAAALLLGACASAPPPLADPVGAAADAVLSAEDARAADYAPAEMRSAHEKLKAARALSAKAGQDPKDPDALKARWLAEEASADAALAEARALNVRTRSAVKQLQQQDAVPGSGGGQS
jgi:hypothetical protein